MAAPKRCRLGRKAKDLFDSLAHSSASREGEFVGKDSDDSLVQIQRMTKLSKPADSAAPLFELILNRFSPRVYDTTAILSDADLQSLGEAFRWAPSSMNQQPWQLVFARRGSELFDRISETGLTGFNRSWAPSASAYAIVLADQLHEGATRDQAGTYFDVGLAAQQMVIQAESMGLRAHYMGGIIHDEIANAVAASNQWVVCIITLGVQGDIEGQEEAVVERERAVRTRKDPSAVYRIEG